MKWVWLTWQMHMENLCWGRQLSHISSVTTASVVNRWMNRCGKGEVTHYNYTFSPQVGQHSYFLLWQSSSLLKTCPVLRISTGYYWMGNEVLKIILWKTLWKSIKLAWIESKMAPQVKYWFSINFFQKLNNQINIFLKQLSSKQISQHPFLTPLRLHSLSVCNLKGFPHLQWIPQLQDYSA